MCGRIITLFGLAMLILGLSGCASTPDVSPDSQNTNFSLAGEKTVHATPERYAVIDHHALQAPPELQNDLAKLALYLTKPANNETEKARSIFRWIAQNISYDFENYLKGRLPDQSTAKVLESGVAVCNGYSNLFDSLAELAGLKTKIIRGKTKGYSYATQGKSGLIGHTWNAVNINGNWYLLDAAWGAGYLDGETKRFVRSFEDHYFLTAPDKFIFDHFPNNKRWQLLAEPLTKSQFNQLPYLRPNFFVAGLKLQSHWQERIIARENPLVITLSAPVDNYISVRLFKGHDKFPRNHVKWNRTGDIYTITTHLPEPGEDYRLRIFTKQGLQSREFDWALDYRVSLQ